MQTCPQAALAVELFTFSRFPPPPPPFLKQLLKLEVYFFLYKVLTCGFSPVESESLISSHDCWSLMSEPVCNAWAFNLAQMLSPTVITRKAMKIYVQQIRN